MGTEVGGGGGGGGVSALRSPDWANAASSTIRSDLLHVKNNRIVDMHFHHRSKVKSSSIFFLCMHVCVSE